MKKVIFSTMALLAFTATSFAAEGKKEVKKAEVKTEVKVVKTVVIVSNPVCDSVWDSWMSMSPPLTKGAAEVAASYFSLLCEKTILTERPAVVCAD